MKIEATKEQEKAIIHQPSTFVSNQEHVWWSGDNIDKGVEVEEQLLSMKSNGSKNVIEQMILYVH